jgi:hypothetical protein
MFLPYVVYILFLYNSKRNSHEQSSFSLTSILNEYLIDIDEQYSKHFLYILATVKNDKQLKYWSKIQRLLKVKKNRSKVRNNMLH